MRYFYVVYFMQSGYACTVLKQQQPATGIASGFNFPAAMKYIQAQTGVMAIPTFFEETTEDRYNDFVKLMNEQSPDDSGPKKSHLSIVKDPI